MPEGQQPPAESREQIITAQAKSLASPSIRAFVTYDPTQALQKLDIPVLAFYGGLDIQVPPSQNAAVMERLFADNPDATVLTLIGLNHLMQPATTGALSEYAQIQTTIAPQVLAVIGNWLESRFVE